MDVHPQQLAVRPDTYRSEDMQEVPREHKYARSPQMVIAPLLGLYYYAYNYYLS